MHWKEDDSGALSENYLSRSLPIASVFGFVSLSFLFSLHNSFE